MGFIILQDERLFFVRVQYTLNVQLNFLRLHKLVCGERKSPPAGIN